MINANLKTVNFLDLPLSLETGKYCPYHKKNDTPMYFHQQSNIRPPSSSLYLLQSDAV